MNLGRFTRVVPLMWAYSATTGSELQNLAFAPPIDVSAGSVVGVSALDLADFDSDGLLDVAVLEGGAHAKGGVTLAWFQQRPDRRWTRHEFGVPPQFNDFVGSARCGDVDGDGDYDLVLSNDGHSSGPINVYLFENPGGEDVVNAWRSRSIAVIDGVHANDMRLEDMDADGLLDVVLRHKEPESAEIVFQNRNEVWTVVNVASGQAGEGLATGDINADGFPDLSLTGHWFRPPADPRVGKYEKYDIEAGYKLVNKATKEALGYIEGDGRLDLLLSPAEHFRVRCGCRWRR